MNSPVYYIRILKNGEPMSEFYVLPHGAACGFVVPEGEFEELALEIMNSDKRTEAARLSILSTVRAGDHLIVLYRDDPANFNYCICQKEMVLRVQATAFTILMASLVKIHKAEYDQDPLEGILSSPGAIELLQHYSTPLSELHRELSKTLIMRISKELEDASHKTPGGSLN